MIVGCYQLHLYCMDCGCFDEPDSGMLRNEREAKSYMRKFGWRFVKTGSGEDAVCRECWGKRGEEKP